MNSREDYPGSSSELGSKRKNTVTKIMSPEELEQESTESERGSRIGVFIDARALFRTEADD